MTEPAEGRLYSLHIAASGVVRDKDGNVIGEQTLEGTTVIDEATAEALRKEGLL